MGTAAVKSLKMLALQGQIALIATAADVWRDAPQRAAQAIDRLMAHRLVDGSAIVRWAFSSSGLLSLNDQVANGLAWEVLYNAVNKTLARAQARFELSHQCHSKLMYSHGSVTTKQVT